MASFALLATVATIACFLNINGAEGKAYKLMKTKANWFKAYQECRIQGDRLATILSETEQKTLEAEIKKDPEANDAADFWIALSDLSKEGDPRWFTTGEKASYVHWAEHQPDNKNDEDCVSIVKAKDYKWNDCKCSDQHFFVCETALLPGQVNPSSN